jgi:hypothetical protein
MSTTLEGGASEDAVSAALPEEALEEEEPEAAEDGRAASILAMTKGEEQ